LSVNAASNYGAPDNAFVYNGAMADRINGTCAVESARISQVSGSEFGSGNRNFGKIS